MSSKLAQDAERLTELVIAVGSCKGCGNMSHKMLLPGQVPRIECSKLEFHLH